MVGTSHSDGLWQAILTAAVLGAQRRPWRLGEDERPEDGAGSALEALLENLRAQQEAGNEGDTSPQDESALLLSAATAVSFYHRAGRLPPVGKPTFPPACPPETRPRCSPAAAQYLETILREGLVALLPEWLETAAARGVRACEEHLPALLDRPPAAGPAPRALIEALGERGRWLAAQHSVWRTRFPNLDGSAWLDGQRSERLTCLAARRSVDPAGALAMLASTWVQEAPSDRVAFLNVLMDGLNPGDEPFLERILDDRRKDVRQAAAALLVRLPGSALSVRMVARARAMLSWRNGLLRGSLDVHPPATCSADMLRDGIDPRPPAGSTQSEGAMTGEDAWILMQVLGAVPPSTWTAAWNRSPEQILEAARRHEWASALLHGWKAAALAMGDAAWLKALLRDTLERGENQHALAMLGRMPPDCQEAVLVEHLRSHPSLAYDQPAAGWLLACRHHWGSELSKAVTECICWTLQKGAVQPWRWEMLLRDISPCFHADDLEKTIETIGHSLRQRPGGDPYVSLLLAVLRFRLEMRRSFDAPQPAVGKPSYQPENT